MWWKISKALVPLLTGRQYLLVVKHPAEEVAKQKPLIALIHYISGNNVSAAGYIIYLRMRILQHTQPHNLRNDTYSTQ